MARPFSTRVGRMTSSYPTCLSYNPSSRPRPTLVNNIYVEHLLETAEDEMVKHEIRLAIMSERMKREECILATSPHKVVANAVRYARAMNYTLSSLLDKRLKLLQDEFEQELRRIVDVQQEAFAAANHSGQSGYTRKQFKRKLSDVLKNKRREDDLRRAKTQLSLPSMPSANLSDEFSATNPQKIRRPKKIAWQRSNDEKVSEVGWRVNEDEKGVGEVGPQYLTISSWKHDGEAVYFPPI